MSSSKKVLVIDCGANHVSAGFFSVSAKGVVLSDFQTEIIGSDYTSDQEWVTAVQGGVRAISKRRKLSGPAYLIAPGHLLLMKFLKIPHVAKSKRDQIVKFEAQQNIPYPLPEVVWDYEVILDDGAEFEVALVAVKIDIMQQLCAFMAAIGIEAHVIDPASMAQFNAFTYSYPEVGEGAIVVNVGAKSSDLLFIDKHGFFVRNVPIAGNTLTQSISDELKMPFARAEDLKLHVFSGQTQGIPDELQQVVHRATEAFHRRFSMEMTRSIVNFRRQSGTDQVSHLYLTGDGAAIPNIIETLSEKLKIAVEWYDGLRNVTVAPKVADKVEPHRLQVGELVGTALRAGDNARTHFNLLPPDLAKQIEFKKKKTFLIAAAAIFVVAAFIPYFNYENLAETYARHGQELEGDLAELRRLDSQVQGNERRVAEIRQHVASLERIAESKGNWIDFLQDMQQRLVTVEDVWLDRFTVVRQQQQQQQQQAGRGGLFDGAGAPPQAASPGAGGVRLNISGRLIDRENPMSRVSPQSQQRVTALLRSFAESDYISAVENERFDPNEPGILRFEFILVLNNERPL
jgi:type IV pilus assembly protein PilM